MADISHDIIIAGGGITGSTLALALAAQGYRPALIDRQLNDYREATGDEPASLRVSTIYAGELNALQRLGVRCANEAPDRQGGDFQRMHIWESGTRAAITFDGATIGQNRLGSVIENRLLIGALLQRLQAAECDLITASIKEIAWSETAVSATLDNGQTLSTPLLVAADGTESFIRRRAALDIVRRDYHQDAIVATVKPARGHQQTAWQKFLPGGPVALLPLANGYCSIVWSTDPDHADHLLNLSNKEFCQQLGAATDTRLGIITETSPRSRFPLFRQQARRYIGNRVALVGDAAHRIHPLAGMGANLGITDALALAELLQGPVQDPGSPAILNPYQRWRLSEVNAYIAAQEALRDCYRWDTRMTAGVRGAGVALLNRSTLVKPELLLRSIGLSGHQPALMRPFSAPAAADPHTGRTS